MSDFVVIGYSESAALDGAITRSYGQSFRQFAPNAWFVSDNGSTKDVADKLGITNGAIDAQGVVLRFDAYSGFGPADTWTWMAQHTRAVTNG